VELRDQVQRVALAWPTYGSRRITSELRRGGLSVNRKRVQRLMREDNLLCLRKRKFVTTTDSAHGLPVYPNLAAALVASGVNQLWRADITYIRLLEEFVYLAVVLDAFSRRAIGWGAGIHAGSPVGRGGAGDGIGAAAARARIGAPFRSGRAVCQPRLCRIVRDAPSPDQHVGPRQSLGQRDLRVVHENADPRRGKGGLGKVEEVGQSVQVRTAAGQGVGGEVISERQRLEV